MVHRMFVEHYFGWLVVNSWHMWTVATQWNGEATKVNPSNQHFKNWKKLHPKHDVPRSARVLVQGLVSFLCSLPSAMWSIFLIAIQIRFSFDALSHHCLVTVQLLLTSRLENILCAIYVPCTPACPGVSITVLNGHMDIKLVLGDLEWVWKYEIWIVVKN